VSDSSHSAETSESAGGGYGADNSEALKDLRNRFINFILLIIILVLVIKKSGAGSFFSNRINEIRQQLDELAREKDESEKKFLEMQQQFQEFEEIKQQIIDRLVNEGKAEKERIIAEAEESANQIISQAEATIEEEVKSALNVLKKEIMAQSAAKAREMILAQLTDEDQDKLVDDFIERVGKVH